MPIIMIFSGSEDRSDLLDTETYRSWTHNGNCVTGFDRDVFKGEIGCRNHIPNEKYVLISKRFRYFDQTHICKRNPYIFCLGSTQSATNGSKTDDATFFTLRRRTFFYNRNNSRNAQMSGR